MLEKLHGFLPVADGALFQAESVVGGPKSGMDPADLAVAVGAILQLVDGLTVVVTGELEHSQLAVDVAADFKGGGESIDAVQVWTEGLLGFFHRSGGGVQGFVEITGSPQGFYAVLKNADEGSGGRVHVAGIF